MRSVPLYNTLMKQINFPFKKVVAYLGSVLIVLALFFTIPVSAESGSLSAPFVGFNVHVLDIDAEYKYIDRGNYKISSVGGGGITGQLNCSSWRSGSDQSTACDIYELESQGNSQVAGLQISIPDFNITNSTNDTFTGTIYKRIYEVEFILDDSYVGYVTFTANNTSYTSYVNGTSFHQNFWSDSATSYTISITDYSLNRNKYGSWNFPIESFSFVSQLLSNKSPIEYYYHSDYIFPIFHLNNNDRLFQIWGNPGNNISIVCILNGNRNNTSALNSNFTVSNGTITNYKRLQDLGSFKFDDGQSYTHLIYFEISPTESNNVFMNYTGSYTHQYIIPIYIGYKSQQSISTDFALTFGLRNELLDNLNILANGTTGSNSAANTLENSTSQMNSSQNSLVTQEDSFNDQMNNSLNNIDPNFNINTQFGSKFITSANWVKTQFDKMTGSTPFGSVLGFSLLLGVGLLIIGRVFG